MEEKKGIKNKELQCSINENINFIVQDKDIKSLFLTGKKKKYLVCGAGPTLADHFHLLQKDDVRNQYILVAVDAAVLPLVNQGIMPDIIVSIDPVAEKLFNGLDMNKFKNIALVYFPTVKSSLLSRWQGPRFTAYSTGMLYDDIYKKYAKGRLYCGGSVIHPSVDLAIKMGGQSVTLLGADFSFPGGETHTHWQEDELENAVHISAEKSPHWVLNSLNERVPTLLNYRGYLRDLEDYISLASHVTFYNGSKRGALIRGTTIWGELDNA